MLPRVASTVAVRQSGQLRRLRLVVVVSLAVLSGFVLWAGYQGYIATDRGCDDRGWPDPPPSFDVLVNDYALSRYCARNARDEAWM
jgi:hypothetical protein